MRGKGKVPSRPAGASGTATRLEAEHWLLSAETKSVFFIVISFSFMLTAMAHSIVTKVLTGSVEVA